jgi:hypothetical protein
MMIGNSLLLADEGYQISRSVRLRSSASAYFNRTPASTTNRRTWTWSAWAKRGSLGAARNLLTAIGSSRVTYITFTSADKLTIYSATSAGGGDGGEYASTQVFRDPSAWYHIVVAYDSTQATSTNRIKAFINGIQITSWSTSTAPTLNHDTQFNWTGAPMQLGAYNVSQFFDGYLTEVNFIDGSTPNTTTRVVNGVTQTILTEFGEFNPVTDVWQPKKYTGTYGTNGFYLNFSDNSAATAAAIGKDYSGNGNNWTPNNITLSPTTSVSYDSMLDVPTQWADGGNGRGNYAVMNPLDRNSSGTVADGNLKWSAGAAQVCVRGTFAIPSSGKWYMECVVGSASSSVVGVSFGLATSDVNLSSSSGATGLYQLYASTNRQINLNNSITGSVSGGFSANDVLQIAVDVDNSKMWLGVNNTWYNSTYTANGDPATGANATSTTSMVGLFPFSNVYSNSVNWNFGQRPFAYTPPSGFKALNTLNLPTPTILKGNQYMDVVTRNGTGTADGQSQVISSLEFTPDLVWNKARSNAFNHNLVDSSRGNNAILFSNLTNAETSVGTTGTQLEITTNGFTAIQRVSYQATNQNGVTYADWCWKEGATQGFDIVTYTGTGANRTVAHSLGVAPAMIITKGRDSVVGATNWKVYHSSLGNTKNLNLNLTNAEAISSTIWNNTSPTSTVFTVGTSGDVNGSTATYVAYLFSEVAGFSKFGSYTGNGSADGPFVFCGFRPRWLMIKRSDASTNWYVYDTARDTYNLTSKELYPNLSNAETTNSIGFDILSNGFKVRTSDAAFNANGGTYIYAAFAENPLKFSLAR